MTVLKITDDVNHTSVNNIILVTPFNGLDQLKNVVSRKTEIQTVIKHSFYYFQLGFLL